MSASRLLIIDDDQELCELVQEFLQSEGFHVASAQDGESGVKAAEQGEFALIILDVMLPGWNGFDVLRKLRALSTAAASTPVLMLTARGEDVDRIIGLELGADDYLSKPFNPRELVARIRAILRRTQVAQSAPSREKLLVGDLELDAGTRTVRKEGALVELTSIEFDLLAVLLRSAGQIANREELTQSVLGRQYNPFDRSLDMHISNLRKKLGREVDGIERIKNVRGVGYLYAASAPRG